MNVRTQICGTGKLLDCRTITPLLTTCILLWLDFLGAIFQLVRERRKGKKKTTKWKVVKRWPRKPPRNLRTHKSQILQLHCKEEEEALEQRLFLIIMELKLYCLWSFNFAESITHDPFFAVSTRLSTLRPQNYFLREEMRHCVLCSICAYSDRPTKEDKNKFMCK